jgi:hypothetical protein
MTKSNLVSSSIVVMLSGLLLPFLLWLAFRFVARVFNRRALLNPPRDVGGPGKVTPTLLAAVVFGPVITVLALLAGEKVASLAFILGSLCNLTAWVLHTLPGHSRNMKYILILFGSSLMGAITSGGKSPATMTLVFVAVTAVAHLIGAIACLALLKPDAPLIAGDVSSGRSLRLHRVVTVIQGSDTKSIVLWFMATLLQLAPFFLYVRWCVKARVSRHSVVYLRSFHFEDAGKVFGQVVTPAVHRSMAVTGLVHMTQPNDSLQKEVPILWRSNFATIADDNWKEWVEHHVGRAIAVVIDASVTTGSVQWELEKVSALLPTDRILVMYQEGRAPPQVSGTKVLGYELSVVGIEKARNELAAWSSRALSSFDEAVQLPPQVSAPRRQLPILLFLCVLGVLITAPAVVAEAYVMNYANNAKLKLERLKLSQISQAATEFYMEQARCPESLDQLSDNLFEPTVDLWGQEPSLKCKVIEGTPMLEVISAGPDGRFETEDDIRSQ